MAQYLTPGPAPVWVSGGFEVTRIVHGAGTRSGGWQPAVGLNIANLKNKRGEASAPLPLQHGMCCSPAPSHSDKGWGQGHLGINSFLSRCSDGLKQGIVNTQWYLCC